MISLAVFGTFFFILVLIYPAVSVILTSIAWTMRLLAARRDTESADRIRERADRIKDRAFLISVIVVFFFIAPFAVVYLYMAGAL
jgi:hypothetical protein